MKTLRACSCLFLALGCSGENTSDVRADYATVRVKELVLTDAAGKPAVTLSAEHRAGNLPVIVVRGTNGAVLKTLELDAAR